MAHLCRAYIHPVVTECHFINGLKEGVKDLSYVLVLTYMYAVQCVCTLYVCSDWLLVHCIFQMGNFEDSVR